MPGRRRGPARTLLARSFADAYIRSICEAYAAAHAAANTGAVARSYRTTNAAAQQPANAGPVASANS